MAIIAISGHAGSGKDTVGRIIQYICWCDSVNSDDLPSFEEWNEVAENPLTQGHQQRWQIKKFAYKLKQIVALLTGCTVEDLENQEFKVKTLPEEWEYVFNESKKPVATNRYEHDEVFIQNRKRFTQNYTYRELLQFVGTNALRDVIHEEIWVNALMCDYTKTVWDPKINDFVEPDWLITDLRFPNEAAAVESRGGITIRVNRDNGTRAIDLNPHPSETALDSHKFKYVIDNDGSISDLINKVQEILTLEKIIK